MNLKSESTYRLRDRWRFLVKQRRASAELCRPIPELDAVLAELKSRGEDVGFVGTTEKQIMERTTR